MAASKNGANPKVNGRPTKRTPERVETVKAALRRGHDWKTASELAGIGDRTLREWREKDPELSAALALARSDADRKVVAELWKLIEKDEMDATKLGAIKLYLTTRTEAFREKKELDITVDDKRSVLVVPARAATTEEWLQSEERRN